MYNLQHKDIPCPECKHPTSLEDKHKGEIFCPKCGLIIRDTTIPSITMLIEHSKSTEKDNQDVISTSNIFSSSDKAAKLYAISKTNSLYLYYHKRDSFSHF